MRTIDLLNIANDAPLSDVDLSVVLADIGRALCIVLVTAILAVAFTGMLGSPTLSRWLLVGGSPALAVVLIAPMFTARGLDTMRIGSEPAGLAAAIAANILALGIMKTLGDTVCSDQNPLYLLQLLLIPALISWMARDAVTKGWVVAEDR